MISYKGFGIVMLYLTIWQVSAKVEKSLVRIQTGEPKGRKIVTMSSGEQMVNLVLEHDGRILDCGSYRRNQLAQSMLKYAVSLDAHN